MDWGRASDSDRDRVAPATLGGLALLCIAAMVGLAACGVRANTPIGTSLEASNHGMPADRLDWDESGIPLNEAIRRSGLAVTLPDDTLLGQPEKVVVDETSADASGRMGIMIRYSGGVKLKVGPSETDLAVLAGRPGAAPFRDGRARPFSEGQVKGLPALLLKEGTQTVRANAESEVPARIIWNMNGCTYQLESAEPRVTLDTLVRIASSF